MTLDRRKAGGARRLRYHSFKELDEDELEEISIMITQLYCDTTSNDDICKVIDEFVVLASDSYVPQELGEKLPPGEVIAIRPGRKSA